jgi:ribosome-binding protein aMBF1 (putative translation factor)
VHDWETDPRPYYQVLRAWREQHGWSWRQVADELREPLATVQLHAEGRYPKGEGKTAQRRRLMTLIDRCGP